MPPLTDEERDELERLAARDDLKSSKWARELLEVNDRIYGHDDE